jgi:hypothetical protein
MPLPRSLLLASLLAAGRAAADAILVHDLVQIDASATGQCEGMPFSDIHSDRSEGGLDYFGDIWAYASTPHCGDGFAEAQAILEYSPPSPGLGSPFRSLHLAAFSNIDWSPVYFTNVSGNLTARTTYTLDFDTQQPTVWSWVGFVYAQSMAPSCTIELRDRATQTVIYSQTYTQLGHTPFAASGLIAAGSYTLAITNPRSRPITDLNSYSDLVTLTGTFTVPAPSCLGLFLLATATRGRRPTRAR